LGSQPAKLALPPAIADHLSAAAWGGQELCEWLLPHLCGLRVSVISGRTNTVTATVSMAEGSAQAVAVNPKTNAIYAPNLDSDAVSVISGRTNTVTATVHVGLEPLGVAADPRTTPSTPPTFRQHGVGTQLPTGTNSPLRIGGALLTRMIRNWEEA